MKKAVLILDCGATNVKACLIAENGSVLASHSLPNNTVNDPNLSFGLIWDVDDIWEKLSVCSKKILKENSDVEVAAITVTTFGVDGAAMKKDGTVCYPAISWQCNRTGSIEKAVGKYFNAENLYQISGLQSYHFNTIYKLIWLKEYQPDVLEDMDYFVFMPSIFLYKLTGEFVTDTTMAGTSMLTDLKSRSFSKEILNAVGLDESIFPGIAEPGEQVGTLTGASAEKLGLRPGIPVFVGGHDTQFALIGSGASINQPVLSSGTWEILMVRTPAGTLKVPDWKEAITIELDALKGLVNPGLQWVASGVLEWVNRLFYADFLGIAEKYNLMIYEASAIPAGSEGVQFIPNLFEGGLFSKAGEISGLNHTTKRGHIYRACLEALSYYTRFAFEKLQHAGNYEAKQLICVGGGTKNKLWNKIRADVLGVPVLISDVKETTALGAAMSCLAGLKVYTNLEEAIQTMSNKFEIVEPNSFTAQYNELYNEFLHKFN